MNPIDHSTSKRTRRRLVAIAVVAGAAAVASVATAVATSGVGTTPLITPGGFQDNSGTNSPAAAATGFLQDFLSGSIATCNFVAPIDEEQCAKVVVTVRVAGPGSAVMTTTIGDVATVGDEALVSFLANKACFSYKLVTPGSVVPKPSCFSNSDLKGGLPTSVSQFAGAYAAANNWPFGRDKAIPCARINGQWYVVIGPGGVGMTGASGAVTPSSTPAG